ncbi:unnamed protein product [Caenorhabditis brenneri]
MYTPQCGGSSFNGDFMDGFYRHEDPEFFKLFYEEDEQMKEELYRDLQNLYGTQPLSNQLNNGTSSPFQKSRPTSPMITAPLITPVSDDDDEFLKIIEYSERNTKRPLEPTIFPKTELCSPTSVLHRSPWDPIDEPPLKRPVKKEHFLYNYEPATPQNGIFTPPMHSPIPPPTNHQPSYDFHCTQKLSWDNVDHFPEYQIEAGKPRSAVAIELN